MPIRVSSGKLVTINTGFRANFMAGKAVPTTEIVWPRVATLVPSTTKENEYGWLKDIPQIREWVGDRMIHAMADDGYKIRNKKYELTVSVKGDDINDDQVGLYSSRFQMMGDEVARFPNRQVFSLLKAGFATNCFDGQYFFDVDHPYVQADGSAGVQSNYQAGANTAWYLLCTKRPLKPLIYQEREPFSFVSRDRPEDPAVFEKDELIYGVDGRSNVGFGFWQMALGSKADLTDVNVKALRSMGESLLGDYGKALGLTYDLFVGPPSLRDQADTLFNTPTLAAGGGNPLYKAFDTLITPYVI